MATNFQYFWLLLGWGAFRTHRRRRMSTEIFKNNMIYWKVRNVLLKGRNPKGTQKEKTRAVLQQIALAWLPVLCSEKPHPDMSQIQWVRLLWRRWNTKHGSGMVAPTYDCWFQTCVVLNSKEISKGKLYHGFEIACCEGLAHGEQVTDKPILFLQRTVTIEKLRTGT